MRVKQRENLHGVRRIDIAIRSEHGNKDPKDGELYPEMTKPREISGGGQQRF